MKRKLKGSTTGAIILFLASGIATSVLGIRQYERISTEPGWVVGATLNKGSLITPDSLVKARLDKDTANNSIQNPRELIGRELKFDKHPGDVILYGDIKLPPRNSLSHAIPEGRVLYTLRYGEGGIPFSQLNSGDRLDVVVRGSRTIRTVARDVQLIGIIRPDSGEIEDKDRGVLDMLQSKSSEDVSARGVPSLVMAVRPSDVYPLASIGNNDRVSLIVHSAHDIAKGTRQTVDPANTYREIEIVSGLARSKVRIGL